MPRIPVDYSKTIIYKLICQDPNVTDFYVGSTTDFRSRKANHNRSCCNPTNKSYNELKYVTIRANGNWDNWRMVEIEKYPCADKREAEAREQHWMDTLNSTLNERKSFRTEEEKKIQKQQCNKKRRLNNIDKIKAQQNEKHNCICGGKYTQIHKAAHFRTKKHQSYLQSQLTNQSSVIDSDSVSVSEDISC